MMSESTLEKLGIDDPLWLEYVEALTSLARIPAARHSRASEHDTEQNAALSAARNARDAQLQRCSQWTAQAGRAIANAQARLVAAKVLIPDTGSQTPVDIEDPETLSHSVKEQAREFEAAIGALQAERRRERLLSEERERSAAKQKLMRRRALTAVIALIVLLLVIWVFS